MSGKRRKKYVQASVPVSKRSTPRCQECGGETLISRTRMDGQGDGIYLRCVSEKHEYFVRLDDMPLLMQKSYAKDGANLPRARQEEYARGAALAVKDLKEGLASIGKLHVPLDELE